LALVQQQCKIGLINHGDENTRVFLCQSKIEKASLTYIYNIKDATGDLVEGFDQVEEAMQSYYKALMGE